MLPPVSEPNAYAASPDATDTAGPPLLPPGTLSTSHGFFTWKKAEFSLLEPIANSSRFPLPSNTAPLEYNFSTTVAL